MTDIIGGVPNPVSTKGTGDRHLQKYVVEDSSDQDEAEFQGAVVAAFTNDAVPLSYEDNVVTIEGAPDLDDTEIYAVIERR